MKIKSKSVRIIKYNNLLCQVNVLLQFHNQLKDNQCKPSNALEQRGKSFTQYYELHECCDRAFMGWSDTEKAL